MKFGEQQKGGTYESRYSIGTPAAEASAWDLHADGYLGAVYTHIRHSNTIEEIETKAAEHADRMIELRRQRYSSMLKPQLAAALERIKAHAAECRAHRNSSTDADAVLLEGVIDLLEGRKPPEWFAEARKK